MGKYKSVNKTTCFKKENGHGKEQIHGKRNPPSGNRIFRSRNDFNNEPSANRNYYDLKEF